MVHIKVFTFNAFSENTYVLYDDTRQGVIIDPGCYDRSERDALAAFIAGEKLDIRHLLNTHGHVDHVLGNAWAKRTYGVKLLVHPLDEQTLRAVQVYAAPMYGLVAYEPTEPDGYLEEGSQVTFGDTTLTCCSCRATPPDTSRFTTPAKRSASAATCCFRAASAATTCPAAITKPSSAVLRTNSSPWVTT
jgi:L-ascorbate metabolism protein UlaG (beta-lactamase superfamily)